MIHLSHFMPQPYEASAVIYKESNIFIQDTNITPTFPI